MHYVHELERVVAEIFDEIYPVQKGRVRALKPFLAPVLACLVPDHNLRRLPDKRTYYRLDFTDFLDYSTSDLASPPLLSQFPDGEVQFYQALNTSPTQPLITFSAFEKGVTILDVALARSKVFVSATMRFQVFGESEGNTLLATQTFASMPKYRGDPSFDPESSPLEEWDRYTMQPPVNDDPQWRFTMSGIYTDYLLDDMEKTPDLPGALPPQQVASARQLREVNHTRYGGIFELTRLALQLPAYFDFMYDLVVEEPVSVSRDSKPRARATGSAAATPPDRPAYRIVKSVRVIRQSPAPDGLTRKWTPPHYSFAVMGHWRNYDDPSVMGHDPLGNVVLGRTWIRDYTKGKGKPPRPEDTESFRADPRVVVSIKQTLAHARDIIQAHAATVESPTPGPASVANPPPAGSKPTIEWMATERAKLTSALRFLIMKRDNFRCRLCGKSAAHDPGVRLEVDHIKPVSSCGTTVEENLWTVCRDCNRGKGHCSLGREE